MKNEEHQSFVKIILLTWTNFFYYKSDLTPNPGPGGSPFRLVSPPIGSDAKRPFLQQKDVTVHRLTIYWITWCTMSQDLSHSLLRTPRTKMT